MADIQLDLDRMFPVSEIARRGVSWLVAECQNGPVWIVRNSKVAAVVRAVPDDN